MMDSFDPNESEVSDIIILDFKTARLTTEESSKNFHARMPN